MPLTKNVPTNDWFKSDTAFNALYPLSIQVLARWHWTPIDVSKKAAEFLAGDGSPRILDIGSGVGKFCLVAAYHTPNALYYGVEQRENLVAHANHAKDTLKLRNASFVHGNFTQLDLRKYDHFYFYNAFYENLAGTDKIDDTIEYSGELYNYYNRYLFKQLEQKPGGTKLCTLCSLEYEIPSGFHEVHSELDGLLKFWIKI
jgi:SAM-dependent methyltransferase